MSNLPFPATGTLHRDAHERQNLCYGDKRKPTCTGFLKTQIGSMTAFFVFSDLAVDTGRTRLIQTSVAFWRAVILPRMQILNSESGDFRDFTKRARKIFGYRRPAKAATAEWRTHCGLDNCKRGGLGHCAFHAAASARAAHGSDNSARRPELELARIRHARGLLALPCA